MYTFDIARLRQLGRAPLAGVGTNVYLLGLTSLLTDVSSEMVGSVLPLYLVAVVGLTPLQLGWVDGLSQAAAAAARLAGGWAADRWRRRRTLAAAGYALSAGCRLLLLAAGQSWGLALASVALDRVGKGVRTAPRDALIASSAAPAQLGLAFGVHRAMDTLGALLGPLLAFAILASLPAAFDLVLAASFFIAVMGLATLVCFVRDVVPRRSAPAPAGAPPVVRAAVLRDPRLRALSAAAAVLALFTVPDAFFFLAIQDRLAPPAAAFALYGSASALSALTLALPAGWLADRFGRGRVFLAGHGLLAAAMIVLLLAGGRAAGAACALGLLGAYYACTDGVLMALASRLAPPDARAAALGGVGAATAVGRLAGSVLFGTLWGAHGASLALVVFAAGLAGATLVSGVVLARGRRPG